MFSKITGFGPPRLSKTEVGVVAVATTLTLISAVAFIALQYIPTPYKGGVAYLGRINRGLYTVITGSAFLAATGVALGILIARSLRYQEKKKEKTPQLVDASVQTDPTLLQPEEQPTPAAEAPKASHTVPIARPYEELKATIKNEVQNFLAAADAIAATNLEIDTQKINGERGRLEKLIINEVSPQGFKQNVKRYIINELAHFAYIVEANKGWKKKKVFLDAGEKNNRVDTELVHALTYFESLKGAELQRVIKGAIAAAEKQGYASLSALGDLLKVEEISSRATLENAIASIPSENFENPERYSRFATHAAQQIKNMMGLPVYLPAYLVMWQEWFKDNPVVKNLGLWALGLPVKCTLPKLLTSNTDLVKNSIKHSIHQKASTQLLARAPMFLRQHVNFDEGEEVLQKEGSQFCLAEIMQALSRPILYTTKPGKKGIEKCGEYIALFFKERESSYNPLKEAPFIALPGFDSHAAVKEFTEHMQKFKK